MDVVDIQTHILMSLTANMSLHSIVKNVCIANLIREEERIHKQRNGLKMMSKELAQKAYNSSPIMKVKIHNLYSMMSNNYVSISPMKTYNARKSKFFKRCMAAFMEILREENER